MNVRKSIAANARDALREGQGDTGYRRHHPVQPRRSGGVEIMAVAARDMAMIVRPRWLIGTGPKTAGADGC